MIETKMLKTRQDLLEHPITGDAPDIDDVEKLLPVFIAWKGNTYTLMHNNGKGWRKEILKQVKRIATETVESYINKTK
jgi:hypothetical protein